MAKENKQKATAKVQKSTSKSAIADADDQHPPAAAHVDKYGTPKDVPLNCDILCPHDTDQYMFFEKLQKDATGSGGTNYKKDVCVNDGYYGIRAGKAMVYLFYDGH